jgi:hypothetical protein
MTLAQALSKQRVRFTAQVGAVTRVCVVCALPRRAVARCTPRRATPRSVTMPEWMRCVACCMPFSACRSVHAAFRSAAHAAFAHTPSALLQHEYLEKVMTTMVSMEAWWPQERKLKELQAAPPPPATRCIQPRRAH